MVGLYIGYAFKNAQMVHAWDIVVLIIGALVNGPIHPKKSSVYIVGNVSPTPARMAGCSIFPGGFCHKQDGGHSI